MADDWRTEKVTSPARIGTYARDSDPHRHHFHHPYEPPPRKSSHSIADAASILGIPEHLLGPALVDALSGLLAEIDLLRNRNEQHERREASLEQQADRDPVVPALNRRAFIRELDSFLRGGGDHVTGTLAVLHVGGLERLGLLQGMAAVEGGLRHIAAHVVGTVRRTDVIALLGGNAFAVLMPGADSEDARSKLAEVIDRINSQPFTWLGQAVAFELRPGFHTLTPGEGGETALAAADRARRGLDGY